MIRKSYRDNLERFIKFVGEPSGTIVRDYSMIVMAIVYILLGIIVVKFPENIFLVIMGFTSSRWLVLLSGILIVGGIAMLITWLFLFNKICWKNKNKAVTAETCWLMVRVLFIIILLFIYIKKIISLVLRETRQQTVAIFIPEIYFAFLSTLFFFGVIELKIMEWIVNWCDKYDDIILTEEFIILCAVIILIATFFKSCRVTVDFSIKLYFKELEKKELKQTGKENVSGKTEDEDVKKKLKEKYSELKEKADKELEYSELYFYVLVNIILLSLHLEESDIYGKMAVNAFVGVTTMAALVREVSMKKEKEKTSEHEGGS